MRRASPRRRGMVYLAALGASMIVMVIGVSAVLAGQLQNRMVDIGRRAIVAQNAAEAAVEFARLQIKINPGWRSAIANNTWSENITFKDATFAIKLVDETDGNLTNDATQSVRLYGKGQIGSGNSGTAARLLSVELAPDATGAMKPVPGSWRQEVLP